MEVRLSIANFALDIDEPIPCDVHWGDNKVETSLTKNKNNIIHTCFEIRSGAPLQRVPVYITFEYQKKLVRSQTTFFIVNDLPEYFA